MYEDHDVQIGEIAKAVLDTINRKIDITIKTLVFFR